MRIFGGDEVDDVVFIEWVVLILMYYHCGKLYFPFFFFFLYYKLIFPS